MKRLYEKDGEQHSRRWVFAGRPKQLRGGCWIIIGFTR